jgi:hypothetical protein
VPLPSTSSSSPRTSRISSRRNFTGSSRRTAAAVRRHCLVDRHPPPANGPSLIPRPVAGAAPRSTRRPRGGGFSHRWLPRALYASVIRCGDRGFASPGQGVQRSRESAVGGRWVIGPIPPAWCHRGGHTSAFTVVRRRTPMTALRLDRMNRRRQKAADPSEPPWQGCRLGVRGSARSHEWNGMPGCGRCGGALTTMACSSGRSATVGRRSAGWKTCADGLRGTATALRPTPQGQRAGAG